MTKHKTIQRNATATTPRNPLAARPASKKSRAAAATKVANHNDGGSKIATVVAMLRSKTGASVDQLTEATGWQRHSVRGAISGAIKKKLGLKVRVEKTDGDRIYRIVR